MWMCTASLNPLVLLSPALLGLTSPQVRAPCSGGISQWHKRLPFCQTERGRFLPHAGHQTHHQRCYKIFTLTVLMQEIKYGSNCLRGKQRTSFKSDTGYLFHLVEDHKIFGYVLIQTRRWNISPLPNGIAVPHPALVGAGEPERAGTKVAE